MKVVTLATLYSFVCTDFENTRDNYRMFLKSYKVKSNAPLKSSEAKKLRQRIQSEYPSANSELLIPNKSSVNVLKLVTHGEFHTNVYSVDKTPMFFEYEDFRLVPTLYSLWMVPDLLPYFTTFKDVLPKLNNGADLMLPGVIPYGIGMNLYGHYKKGQLVAINLTSNKSAIGVGYLAKSSDDLYMSGGHGVAVKILHVFGDKLWSHEPSLAKQVPQYKNIKLSDDDFPPLGSTQPKQEVHSNIDEENNKMEKMNISKYELNDRIQGCNDVSSNDISSESKEQENNDPSSANAPELLLKKAFLTALKNNGKNLQLPILTSNFYRIYVVPESEETLDLKKTKYKKLSNFLNEMVDQGFIVVREETKGVYKITFIDLEHPELVNFITDIKKPKNSSDVSSDNPLFHSELTELYTITDATAPLFSKINYKRGSSIPATQIKKAIREYINKQNLLLSKDVQNGDKSYILDECLEKLCNTKLASMSKIINIVISQMDHSYQMCTSNDVKSNKPQIQMSLATRSGNKKVTLVSNIEFYGIILTEFIKLCKQGAAASTTIVTLPHQNREMLQIQGNQVRFVYNLLTETYKIPQKCILGLELAKDAKKHKKK